MSVSGLIVLCDHLHGYIVGRHPEFRRVMTRLSGVNPEILGDFSLSVDASDRVAIFKRRAIWSG
jgi:hypothetical protein